MHSIIITGGNKNTRFNKAKILSKYKKNDLNRNILLIYPEKEFIGIKQIREAEKFLHVKSIKKINKYLILPQAEKLTTQAQNAFLKTLEEPPANSVIILCAPNKNLLLPTIVSRCILLKDKQKTQQNNEAILNFPNFPNFPNDQVLTYFANNKNLWESKENALNFLENLEDNFKTKISDRSVSLFLKKVIKTKKIIRESNSNLRLTLETTFLRS